MNQFEDFDPTRDDQFFASGQSADDQFQNNAASAASNAMAELSVETFGGLSDSQDQVTSLLGARDELEKRLMAPVGASAAALSDEEPYVSNNVVGVGIGEKEIRGVLTGQLVVKVLVKEKKREKSIGSETLVPPEVGGVPTDVEETGEVYAHMFTARRRPAPCGVSIGNCLRVMGGTLGCLVTRNGQLFILSNNHVMALVNTSPLNTGIPQPGRLDGGLCPQDIIARLTQFVPINFAPGALNFVDAAIAQTSPGLVDRRILRLGGVLQPITPGIVAPVMNMPVQKSGRTTQYRRGFVDLINTTVDVSYAPLGGTARFSRQFRVRGTGNIFSDRGDSGSLVTTFPQNQPVGLLFSGTAASNLTFCNPISTVLGSFGVSIVF